MGSGAGRSILQRRSVRVSKIVLDAMGGDHAPDAILQGAGLAVERGFARAEDVILVGPEGVVRDAALLVRRVVDAGAI